MKNSNLRIISIIKPFQKSIIAPIIMTLLFLIICNSNLFAQEDPLKIEENGDVKIQRLLIGDWEIQESNGKLVFRKGTKTFSLTDYGGIEQNLKIGDAYAGGIIFYLDPSGQHGLICEWEDRYARTWDDAMVHRGIWYGYENWRLPLCYEMEVLKEHLGEGGLGNINGEFYWSSEERNETDAWVMNINSLIKDYASKGESHPVRYVRSF